MSVMKILNKTSITFFLIILVFEVLFVCLAVWQYNRMHEKQAIFEIYSKTLLNPSQNFNTTQDYKEWDVVRIEGTFDYADEKILQNRHYKSYMGYRVLTPLVLADGKRILIDRGWIPKNFDSAPPKALEDKMGKVSFTGVVRYIPQKKGWLEGPLYGVTKRVIKRVDLIAFSRGVEYKDFLIQATSSGNRNIRSFVDKPLTGAKHGEYMLTWLALAFILPSLYAALILQQYRRQL